MSTDASHDDLSASLLAAFQSRFGISSEPAAPTALSTNTKVLDCAEYVASQAIDVFTDRVGVQSAARSLLASIRRKPFSAADWTAHELHPDPRDGSMSAEEVARFIFVMDLLNYSFWTDESEGAQFYVEWSGRRWTGYWSLVACLRRAREEGLPVTDLKWWGAPERGMGTMRYVFSGGGGVRRRPRWMRREEEEERQPAPVAENVHERTDPDVPYDTPAESVGEHVQVDDLEADHEMQDVSIEPIELPTHDAPTIEKQASPGTSEPRPASKAEDELTLVDSESLADIDSDDESDDETLDGRPAAEMPLLRERLSCLKEASRILAQSYNDDPLDLIRAAENSAGRLVNLLARDFPCFNDTHVYEGYKIRLQKRAQILAADLWACFQGATGTPGEFTDIDALTAFADYRIPQMLYTLGVLSYSPPLEARIRRGETLESGGSWEVQLRGCAVWAVELLRREIVRVAGDEGEQVEVNAVLLDFHLYDSMTELERRREAGDEDVLGMVPHHRTRSIWY